MWIEEFRRQHGLTRLELSKIVKVSQELITILEEQPRGVTHPKLANRLAAACGATPAQRDQIVNKIHAGTWEPDNSQKYAARAANYLRRRAEARAMAEEARKRAEAEARERARAAELRALNGTGAAQHYGGTPKRPVVMIDREGNVLKVYESVKAAADGEKWTDANVAQKCRRVVKNEFRFSDTTFRYADEWNAMTPAQRVDDVKMGSVNAASRHLARMRNGRPVVCLNKGGTVLRRYGSIMEASDCEKCTKSMIFRRANRQAGREFRYMDITFRYADEWDAMTPAQRQADLQRRRA